MKSSFRFLSLAAVLSTGCTGAVDLQTKQQALETPCGADEEVCLVNGSTSSQVYYMVVENREAFKLESCSLADALKLSRTDNTEPPYFSPLALKRTYHAEENPIVACADENGQYPLDPGFNTEDAVFVDFDQKVVVLRHQRSGADEFYFKVPMKCNNMMESLHVDGSRLFEEDLSLLEGVTIRPLGCGDASTVLPQPPVVGSWRMYHVKLFRDVDEYAEPTTRDKEYIYLAEYRDGMGNKTFLGIKEVMYDGLLYEADDVINDSLYYECVEIKEDKCRIRPREGIFEEDLIEEIESELKALFNNFEDIETITQANNTKITEIVENIELSPVVQINLGEPGELIVSVDNISVALNPWGMPRAGYFRAVDSQQEEFQVDFFDGRQARAFLVHLDDNQPRESVSVGYTKKLVIKEGESRQYNVLYLFEECLADQENAFLAERIGFPIVEDYEAAYGFAKEQWKARIDKLNDMRRLSFVSADNPDGSINRVIRFPCLMRNRCVLDIASESDWRAILEGDQGTVQCSVETKILELVLKEDLVIENKDEYDPFNHPLKISRELLSSRLPLVDTVRIVGHEGSKTIRYQCDSCYDDLVCGNYQDNPVFVVANMDTVEFRDIRIEIDLISEDGRRPMGIDAENTRLVLRNVSIGSSGAEQVPLPYKGLCLDSVRFYGSSLDIVSNMYPVYSRRSHIVMHHDKIRENNPNISDISPLFDSFPRKETATEQITPVSFIESTNRRGIGMYLQDTLAYLSSLSIMSNYDAIKTNNESHLWCHACDLFGPMADQDDLSFDPNLAHNYSSAYRPKETKDQCSATFSYPRVIGFRYVAYFPRGANVDGVNDVMFWLPSENLEENNLVLHNAPTGAYRVGTYTCSGFQCTAY